ncbi:hypothetical protein LSH36_41g01019 [Paralvinella palmiformis]|uniref:Cadherin domain-containing protein n=1 Tax=Paralvinella palmiformis TaxID=53620 RepID=A0AAD9K787_9ANNE|nr:hypothetical protein LSH36_41g01019 [Paralvinella palmiformis]
MSATCLAAGYLLILQAFLASCLPQIDIAITVIEEVLVPDSVVRNLTEDPRIKSRFSRDELDMIRYQYLSSKPVAFSVDENGALRTTSWVDRESICPNSDLCLVEFDLAIQPIKYFALVKVSIVIQDINDHSPLFVRSDITHVISESTRTGMTFVLPKVTDPDSPQFSVKRVFLRPPTEKFGLRTNDELQGIHAVRLVLKSSLDRESVPEYHLQVVAVDGGSPAKSGTLDITIVVADANDNHPTFDRDLYEVTVPENVPSGYIMLSVHATDLDIGLNSRIVYRWSPDTATSLGHIFHIDNDTGEITVRGRVDYEEAPVLYLTVEAQDCGADPIPAEATITIHIEDVNDHAPEILIHTLGGPGNDQVTVLEGSARGTFVARIVVSDQDSGDNARYNCSLDNERFVLDPLDSDFLITTRGELDREKQSHYSLAISCRDYGRKPLTSITYIQVDIADLNDNNPRFSTDAYYTRITENNYPRTILTQMNATDVDSGRNGEIDYSIEGTESEWFSIDKASGVVKTKVSLDREVKVSHQLCIIARDRGDPPNSAVTTLTVDVLDTNDEAPKFSQDTYVFRVYENEDPDTAVGFVQADDADSPEFNHHTYSLQADSQSPFRIGMKNGRIKTKRRLDRERTGIYVLKVVAMDTSEPYFSSTATVSVHILDRNDNPPRFTFPTARNNTARIGNKLPVGYVVTMVHAEDVDWESNGQVRYELVQPGIDLDYFDVEPYTGVVRLASSIRHIDNDTFPLTIIASDGGDVTMSTSARLYVIVDERYAVPMTGSDIGRLSNLITIILVACISGILVVVLVGGILVICHRRRHLDDRERRHKGQMEPLKDFSAKEATCLVGSGLPKKGQCLPMANRYLPEGDGTASLKCPPKYGCHDNHFNPGQADLSLGKSKSWIDMDGSIKECRIDIPRRESTNESLELVLQSDNDSDHHQTGSDDFGLQPTLEYGILRESTNESLELVLQSDNDSDHHQTGSDDFGLQPTLEYGILRGFYKNPVTAPLSISTELSTDGYGGNLKTFTGRTAGVNPCIVKSRSAYIGHQVRSSPGQSKRTDCDSSTDRCDIRTPDPHLIAKHNPVTEAIADRRTSGKPYPESARSRCQDSLTRSPQYQTTTKTLPYISAHGYRDDVTPTGVGHRFNQPAPSSAKRLRFNLENINDYCRAKTPDKYLPEMDDTTVTHTENGVKGHRYCHVIVYHFRL